MKEIRRILIAILCLNYGINSIVFANESSSLESTYSSFDDSIYYEPINAAKTGLTNSIICAIFGYQKRKRELFLRATITDEDQFYGWHVPGQVLEHAFYKGKQISFHWRGYTIGLGDEYEMIECFVNESGTDLVVFAMRDGERFVFQSVTAPKNGKLNIELSKDDSLNQFLAKPESHRNN